MFLEFCFSPGLIWFSVCSTGREGKCVFLEISSEATMPGSLCSCAYKHSQQTFPILNETPRGKGTFPVKFQNRFPLSVPYCCTEAKGRSSQSCDWHLAAFLLCWARWFWPGQEEVPMIQMDQFLFSPSPSHSYCLEFPDTADLGASPLLYLLPAVALTFWSLHLHETI